MVSGTQHRLRITIMSSFLLALQGCLFHGSRPTSPLEPAPPVSIAVLPLNISEPPQTQPGGTQAVGGVGQNQAPPGRPLGLPGEEPTLQSLSLACAVSASDMLHSISGIEPVPIWRTIAAASNLSDKSHWVTPSKAAELATVLGVHWAMMGSISPRNVGYSLIIDFIPAKSSLIPFRYQTTLRPNLLTRKLGEALEQFLRYARHPAPQLKAQTSTLDLNELIRLAEALDKEYGWFLPAAPGKAQAAFAALLARDPQLASLLFSPDLYAVATALPVEDVPSVVSIPSKPGVINTPAQPNPIMAVPVREPTKQPAPSSLVHSTDLADKSRWITLTVSPVLSIAGEEELNLGRSNIVRLGKESEPFGTLLSGVLGARYVLQLFALANELAAKQVAQDLMQAGAHASISMLRRGRAILYRVSGGTYDSPANASAAGDVLVALHMADAYWIRAEAAPAAIARLGPAGEPPSKVEGAEAGAREIEVQVFASSDRGKAVALAETLRQFGLQTRVEPFKDTGDGYFYRVRLTGYPSRAEAAATAAKLRAEGRIGDYWIIR